MVKNYRAITTLFRNKLSNKDGNIDFFHEKGITVKTVNENLHFLVAEENGHESEVKHIATNGLIFRGVELVCYKGQPDKKMTAEEAKDKVPTKKDAAFVEYIEGKRIFMYWDPKLKDWSFTEINKEVSKIGETVRKSTYNIMGVEPNFTYVFIAPKKKKGNFQFYLERMYENKTGSEVHWRKVYSYALRLKVNPLKYFYFEGFDKLEETDLPVYIIDDSNRKTLITELS